MPCRDWEEYDRVATPELRVSEDEVTRLREKTDFLTAQLCWACETLERETAATMPQKLIIWWEHHKVADENRRQAVRRAALAKLTPEERELLGLTT